MKILVGVLLILVVVFAVGATSRTKTRPAVPRPLFHKRAPAPRFRVRVPQPQFVNAIFVTRERQRTVIPAAPELAPPQPTWVPTPEPKGHFELRRSCGPNGCVQTNVWVPDPETPAAPLPNAGVSIPAPKFEPEPSESVGSCEYTTTRRFFGRRRR